MANYPASIYTPATKSNGQAIDASHINDIQAEVTAVETALKNGLAHNLIFTDATYDIGQSGATRPRHLFMSGNATVAGTADITGNVTTAVITAAGAISASAAALGAGAVAGRNITAGRNSSGSGAPGTLTSQARDGSVWSIWVDASGNARVLNSQPTESGGDLVGTVIGTQTSQRDTKDISGPFAGDALATILNTPIYVFRYKSGAYANTEFVGIVAEDSPAFAMDAGKSFNPISAFGYTVTAFKQMAAQLEDLKREVEALKARG